MGEREPTTSSASTCGDAMDAARPAKRPRCGGTRGPARTAPPSGVVHMAGGGGARPLAAPAPAPTSTAAPAGAPAQEETSWDPQVPPYVSPSGRFIRELFAPSAAALRSALEVADGYDPSCWRVVEGSVLLYESRGWEAGLPKQASALPVAALDLDSAVIDGAPFGGLTLPKSDDFKLRFGEATASKLRAQHDKGNLVALLSNQSTVGCGQVKDSVAWLKRRVEAVQAELDVPLTCYVALKFDRHRMPCIGLWQCLKKRLAAFNVEVDRSSSFYVGGRCGRAGDASTLDFKFALNVGLKLRTPESLFEDAPVERMAPDIFRPRDYVTLEDDTTALPPLRNVVKPPELVDLISARDKAYMVLLTGGPCTGKTTFATGHLAHLEHFPETTPQQNLATRNSRAVRPNPAEIRDALKAGRGVVLDGTHGRQAGRQYYANLAERLEVPIYCLRFDPPRDLVRHLDACREISTNGAEPRSGELVFESYEARRQPVVAKEGYSAPIGDVTFRAHFASPEEKEVFTRFT